MISVSYRCRDARRAVLGSVVSARSYPWPQLELVDGRHSLCLLLSLLGTEDDCAIRIPIGQW